MTPFTNTVLKLHLKNGLWTIPVETIANEHGKIYLPPTISEANLQIA